MRIFAGAVAAALALSAASAAAESESGRYELVSGPFLEAGQFLFKIDTETGSTWWTVIAPSKESGKMFIGEWHLIPDAAKGTPVPAGIPLPQTEAPKAIEDSDPAR